MQEPGTASVKQHQLQSYPLSKVSHSCFGTYTCCHSNSSLDTERNKTNVESFHQKTLTTILGRGGGETTDTSLVPSAQLRARLKTTLISLNIHHTDFQQTPIDTTNT
jgi:hypothetical protein